MSARTVVDFAVPFSPRTSTPPMPGEIALRMRARRMSSMPTTALNGNNSCADGVYTPQPFTRQVSAPAVSDDHWAAARWHGCRCPGSRSLTAFPRPATVAGPPRTWPRHASRTGVPRQPFIGDRLTALRHTVSRAQPPRHRCRDRRGGLGRAEPQPRRQALSAAQVIIGGSRQLDLLPESRDR